MQAYSHPEVLVSTDWAVQHKNDRRLVIVEVDVDNMVHRRSGGVWSVRRWNGGHDDEAR